MTAMKNRRGSTKGEARRAPILNLQRLQGVLELGPRAAIAARSVEAGVVDERLSGADADGVMLEVRVGQRQAQTSFSPRMQARSI